MEYYISGYCRIMDSSRMVEIEVEKGELLEADCCYPDCVYAPNCTVAAAIKEKLEA